MFVPVLSVPTVSSVRWQRETSLFYCSHFAGRSWGAGGESTYKTAVHPFIVLFLFVLDVSLEHSQDKYHWLEIFPTCIFHPLYLIITFCFSKGLRGKPGVKGDKGESGRDVNAHWIKLLAVEKGTAQHKNIHLLLFPSVCLRLQTTVGYRRFAWSHWHRWGSRFTRSKRTEGKRMKEF